MSAPYAEYPPHMDAIPEAIWTRLEQRLHIGSRLSAENEQLREQIRHFEAREKHYSAYEDMYNKAIGGHDQLIHALLEDLAKAGRACSRSEDIAIDPAKTTNYNTSSFLSTSSKVSQEATR